MSILAHVTVGTNDLEKARSFYDAVLETIGVRRLADFATGSAYGRDKPEFFVLTPANGDVATVGNGVTVCLTAPDNASIGAFHAAALRLGGVDEGAVGPRGWAENAYAGYVRDLDGNKLAAYNLSGE